MQMVVVGGEGGARGWCGSIDWRRWLWGVKIVANNVDGGGKR